MPVEAGDIRMNTPLGTVRAIAPRDADRLATLGLTTVGELIAHLPMRYEREEAESSIENLPADAVVSARGEVTATRVAGFGRKQRFEAVLHDGSGRLDLVWFSQPYLHRKIGAGTRLRIQGKSRRRGGGLQVANPRWELIDDGGGEPGSREARLRPVYPASEAIDSRSIESCVRSVLRPAIVRLEDHLSPELRRERELPALHDAFLMVHEPRDDGEIASGRRRLAYDELLLLQLGVQLKRAHRERTLAAPRIEVDGTLDARIRERFPFELTSAQEKVVAEIARDLARPIPANRLIQGDVGSGKTVVALYALLAAVAVGQQGVLMAPTSLLAEQHFLSISGMLEGSRVRVELLTGSLAAGERAGVLAALESGEIDVLIGTHALLTEGVRFDSLAVAVIDEQHRFGVRQRAALRTKGDAAGDKPVVPHTFVMTATPIPRTLAMTLLGDLDVSTIDGLPPGRTPVRTKVVGRDKRDTVYTWVRERLDEGEQAYVVVPAIESGGDEDATLRAVVRELESGALSGKRVAAIHGRLKRSTREHVMGRFRSGLIDCLVATTVIEVGVDVPNASVMVIEQSERFGLAQLHQLRGRVGRGARASVCVLIGEPTTEDGAARLGAMRDSTDGFELAEKDLELRGMGELFGARQSGLPPFRVADPTRDLELLRLARRDAQEWIERSPDLGGPEEALVRRRLLRRYGESLGLGDIA